MRHTSIVSWAFLGLASALPASAQRPSPAMTPLFACRAIAAEKERLTCFDRETAALEAATGQKEIVVLDQADVRRTKRSLFGFSLPNLKLFDGAVGSKDPREAEENRRLETSITSIGRTPEGVQFSVDGGAVWTQSDERALMLGRIKPGSQVVIQRAAMGSYFAIFPGQPGIRVRRTR